MEKFAFCFHPLDLEDVVRFEPKARGKRRPLVEKILEWMPAFEVSHITGIVSATGKELEGWFIGIPFFPEQITTFDRDRVLNKIVEGGHLAEKKGSKIMGMGGYTSVVIDGGISVAEALDIAVTSGNSYTISTAIQGALRGAELMEINMEKAHVAIVGATGAIGEVCTKILAPKVKDITLVARNRARLEEYAKEVAETLNPSVSFSSDISGIINADIVITATSSLGGIISDKVLKPGCVVCDVSLPHDVCRDVAQKRPDVLVIEGGLVEIPGNVVFNYDLGYPQGLALACMAETMILALEGRFEDYSIGRGLKLEKVEEITALAAKHGFKLGGIRSFDKFITEEQIGVIKEHARKKVKG